MVNARISHNHARREWMLTGQQALQWLGSQIPEPWLNRSLDPPSGHPKHPYPPLRHGKHGKPPQLLCVVDCWEPLKKEHLTLPSWCQLS